jgi:hypothetical protein
MFWLECEIVNMSCFIIRAMRAVSFQSGCRNCTRLWIGRNEAEIFVRTSFFRWRPPPTPPRLHLHSTTLIPIDHPSIVLSIRWHFYPTRSHSGTSKSYRASIMAPIGALLALLEVPQHEPRLLYFSYANVSRSVRWSRDSCEVPRSIEAWAKYIRRSMNGATASCPKTWAERSSTLLRRIVFLSYSWKS